MPAQFKKIAVFFNQHKEAAARWAKAVNELIEAKGACAVNIPCRDHGKWDENADLVIALGGDGTVLHAARDLAGRDIPLLGVNTGSLGFLSGMDVRDFADRFDAVLSGGYAIQERFLLQAEVFSGAKKIVDAQIAFNDCVIKAMEPRAFSMEAQYGDKFLKTYLGDGLIIATPTGSTAYALAASGPIVYPVLDVIVLVPICPHALTQRPLVLPADSPISVLPQVGHGDFRRHPILSVDGQLNFKLNPGDRVVISKHKDRIKLMLPPDYDYFEVLNKKMKWGER